MNGSVCRKKRIFLHPEHRLADWQVGPPVVGHGTLGEPVATGHEGRSQLRITPYIHQKNTEHRPY
jgi:hypothetical protein